MNEKCICGHEAVQHDGGYCSAEVDGEVCGCDKLTIKQPEVKMPYGVKELQEPADKQ
jgi:hypothetical protein